MRMPSERAAICSLIGGYMLLPADWALDAPLLPPLDKMAISSIATVLLCWMKGSQQRQPASRSWLIYLLATAFVLSPILTSLDNSYELQTAGRSVRGFYPLDGLKFAGRNVIALIPLYIGARFLSTDSARLQLLKALPMAMVVYSLPMLFEVRMSPQIHRRVYGYFPGDSFAQQMRAGGFRPVVFFSHGLELALFTSLALLALLVLVRMRARLLRMPAAAVATYLSGLLLLCKSLGPVLYTVAFAPIILVTRPRTWLKIGCAASLLLCAYPLLRNHGLAPTQIVSKVASAVSANRAASFQTRVENEGALLAKANQKPILGWGAWGRNRIFDQWTGKDVSITDGGWIIQYGTFGWLGYLSLFGLFAAAQFRALRTTGKEITQQSLTRAGLAVLLTIYLVDSIPNSTEVSLVFLLAGSVAGSQATSRKRSVRISPEVSSSPVVAAQFGRALS